jgi:hypothetical protein
MYFASETVLVRLLKYPTFMICSITVCLTSTSKCEVSESSNRLQPYSAAKAYLMWLMRISRTLVEPSGHTSGPSDASPILRARLVLDFISQLSQISNSWAILAW